MTNRTQHCAGCRERQAEIDRLLADKWQPIETAPKDGTVVLLYKPDERMVGEYMLAGYWGQWPGINDCWIACDGKPQGYLSGVTGTYQGHPTHWMPLPNPPAP